jgi:hypothetical protein
MKFILTAGLKNASPAIEPPGGPAHSTNIGRAGRRPS